jgi:hypothetical protein
MNYYWNKRSYPYCGIFNTGRFFFLIVLYLILTTIALEQNRENSFVCERNVQNFPIHVIRALYIDVSSYLTLTIQASSRLKRSANHLWNNDDVCRKKFGEWSLFVLLFFLTVYTCITFHFFALALGEKGVFYSDKKISMLHFCTWKKNGPFMTNNKNLGKRIKNQNHTWQQIHLYL